MAVPETTPQKRWITLIEVLLGAFIVIGHNVYHFVPNEVPFLFVLFWISPRLLRGKWDLSALRRPESWWKTIGIAVAATVVLHLGAQLVVMPLTAHFFPQPQHTPSVIKMAALGWNP